MKPLLKRLITQIKIKLGYDNCPECKELVRFKFIKLTIYDPEEPPMFARFQCPECNWLSDIYRSKLLDKAAIKRGYKDFDDFAEKNFF